MTYEEYDRILRELMLEWFSSKERGEYEAFEKHLISLDSEMWRKIVYGERLS